MCLPMAAGTPGLLLTAAAAAKYFFRKEDKHLQIKWGYGDSEKFVEPENIHIEPLVAICTGMQREDIICLHSKTRFKVGNEHNEREPNPSPTHATTGTLATATTKRPAKSLSLLRAALKSLTASSRSTASSSCSRASAAFTSSSTQTRRATT